MTVLLVVAMLAVLVAAQLYWMAQRHRVARRARDAVKFVEVGAGAQPADDVLFHPGHTWVQNHGKGLASIGVSAFAANFAGEVASIETPPQGRHLHQADRALTLVSSRGRRLELPMPIEGEILAINEDVRRDPTLLQRRPYDQGWVLRVKPRHADAAARNLLPVAGAQRWIDWTRAAVTARLAVVPGAFAFDGGEWSRAFGERLDDSDWNALHRELFPAAPKHVANTPSGAN